MKGRKSNPREHGSRRWGAGSGCIAAVLPLLLVTWGSYLPAAAEQLEAQGLTDATSLRHAEYFLTAAEQRGARSEEELRDWMEIERDNGLAIAARFAGEVAPGWDIGGNANGGYLMAIA